jgi:pyrroloquinoline quinone (PQQ) biosynthesis protein C
MHLEQLLDQSLEGRRLLEHPFYRRWEAGLLVDGELRNYAEQYRYFESHLVEFLGALAQRLPEGVARASVRDNLRDEVSSPSHLELFEQFAEFYEAHGAPISPAMDRLIAAYESVLERSNAVALAGLLAYEVQGAGIAVSKSEGLRQHYGASDAAAMFWDVHGTLEGDHARWTLDGLAALSPSDEDVRSGVSDVANAWWEFLTEREALVAA